MVQHYEGNLAKFRMHLLGTQQPHFSEATRKVHLKNMKIHLHKFTIALFVIAKYWKLNAQA